MASLKKNKIKESINLALQWLLYSGIQNLDNPQPVDSPEPVDNSILNVIDDIDNDEEEGNLNQKKTIKFDLQQ